MDFGLSEDQLLLEKTVRSFLAEQVGIDRVRELRDHDCPNDRTIWRALAELGVSGVLVPEAQGGAGLALLDAALISQALGHAVTPTPFLSSAVMLPTALAELGGSASEEAVREAFSIILSDEAVKGVLVNIFGGIMQCDKIARGIVDAAKSIGFSVPPVVRLEGTNVDDAREILESAKSELPTMQTARDLSEAAEKIAAAVA